MIKAGEISEIIKRQLAGYEAEVDLQEVGRVIEVGDGIARVYGLEKAMAPASSRIFTTCATVERFCPMAT